MSPAELSIPFGLGVVASLHCSQMCGPLVLAYSLPLHSAGKRALGAHVTYNVGRLATYALLGAIAGAAGSGVAAIGRLAGFEKTATLAAGGLMVLAGLLTIGWAHRPSFVKIGAAPSFFSRAAGRLMGIGTGSNKLPLGFLMGFLPCGMVYAALLKAVETGSALEGALSMVAFGAGTAGALLAIGFFSSAITARFGRYANVLAATSMIVLGGYLVYRGVHAPTPQSPTCHHGHAS